MNKKYLLQFGLAFTLLYAGISALVHPYDWIGFVPMWITQFGITREFALRSHSVVEILLAVWLLSNKKINLAGLVTALDMAVILLANGFGRGTFLITFRDAGLLFMAIYLAVADE